MPPYANGEVGRVGSPKRREIGHGLLAERALLPVVPSFEDFPYALRLVSEVLSSNGSMSMASVCASTLSLMDAGVPIKAPVAGIAMGLVKEGDNFVTLTDILGAEDAFGDMDFKVAGPADFVTALQLDTKIDGLPANVLGDALRQARDARLAILKVMNEAISQPRAEVRDSAPKIVTLEIPMDKIGEVIGPKGKMINSIQQETGADISVDDNGVVGTVTVGARDGGAVKEAVRRIELILDPPRAEVGAIYKGKVVNITKFGAFVNILPGRDGLVHISKLSKLSQGKRVERVEDVLTLGEELEVHVDDIDPMGKVSLSLEDPNGPSTGPAAGARGASPAAPGAEPVSGVDFETVSFEETWEEEARSTFGDLGPASATEPASGASPASRGPSRDRGERSSDRSGDRGQGPRRNPRRRH
jgi:polyribonucleotide nucleotidyltransferase